MEKQTRIELVKELHDLMGWDDEALRILVQPLPKDKIQDLVNRIKGVK